MPDRSALQSINLDVDALDWGPAEAFYGPAATVDGRRLVHLKILSDRRRDGGGIAWLVRFTPPAGKLIKIVAVARSDEHVFNLSGGRANKAGKPVAAPGGYALNPKGQPHSAFIGSDTEALIVYTGEPDEVTALELVDKADPA